LKIGFLDFANFRNETIDSTTENTKYYFPKQTGIIKFFIFLHSVPAFFSKI